MRQKLFTFGVVALGFLAYGVRAADAQTFGVGPYYPVPSWDQTFSCISNGFLGDNCPRFVILNNFNRAAVMDRETGLVWEKAPDPVSKTWEDAQFSCNNKTAGNRAGWRLPTVQEIASLADLSEDDPVTYLPPAHPFVGGARGTYWSATVSAANPDDAWDVNLVPNALFRFVERTDPKTAQRFVLCVRGGRGVDAQ